MTMLTRDEIVSEIAYAVRDGAANINSVHDRLCGRSRQDSRYFDTVLGELIRDGALVSVRPGFVATR